MILAGKRASKKLRFSNLSRLTSLVGLKLRRTLEISLLIQGGEVSASWQNRGERCVWTMENKCLSAFRGAIVRPVTFPRGPPSSQACPRPSVGADLGWNRPAIWGISVEELFHDARHPHSQNRQTRRFLSRPRDRRFCWRETRRPLIWRAFFSCYRHWISIRVKLR